MHEQIIADLKKELETYKSALREQSMKVSKISAEKQHILESATAHIKRGDADMRQLEAAIEEVKALAIVIVDQAFTDHPMKNEVTAKLAQLGPKRIQ